MYVDTSTVQQGDKSYTRHLLRESYREGKKVRHRTIANLSHCSEEEIAAIRLALRHKKNLSELTTTGKEQTFAQKQGLSIGASGAGCSSCKGFRTLRKERRYCTI